MIYSGRKTILTAGKREQLVTVPMTVDRVDIWALDSNTDRVHVGDYTVQAPSGLETGWPLTAKEGLTLTNIDLSTVWVDARVAGEGVSWGAERGTDV